MKEDLYKNPICITQQFRFCGNPFRIDMYRGCDFGCQYCFANARQGNFEVKWQTADEKMVERAFHKAFDEDKDKVKTYAQLLYNQALLIEGMPVEDPVEFSNSICNLMI